MAAFIILPTTPIFLPRTTEGTLLNSNTALGTFDWIAFFAQVLSRESRSRLYLLTWARYEARQIVIARNMPKPPGSGTLADYCREKGASWTFNRTVSRCYRFLAAV